MIGYKLFRKRNDGTYGPLFINKRQRLVVGEAYQAEDHKTKGYAHRPGWHICTHTSGAPHLKQGGERVWCQVEFEPLAKIERPACQGGVWYLGSSMTILKELA